MKVSLSDLYLAYRQAKISLFYERRGVGLLQLAKYEQDLERNLLTLQAILAEGSWFDGIPMGDIWVVPKRVHPPVQSGPVLKVGGTTDNHAGLDIQLRCSPRVLYIWRFGPALDSLLSANAIGYRLDLRDGELRKASRWLFEYWPSRYEQFRRVPLEQANAALSEDQNSIVILSADFAGYYDTVHGGFLTGSSMLSKLRGTSRSGRLPANYLAASRSLLRSHDAFRTRAEKLTGLSWKCGIPIGPLTSRVVANLALQTVDEGIETNRSVICYRRYVDDLVLVARATPDEDVDVETLVPKLIPASRRTEDGFVLDGATLHRPGCELALQDRKLAVHHLSGAKGRTFLSAVAGDYDRLVSEGRAFLDPSVLAGAAAKHVIRANGGKSSPLRVLRDADRGTLERFALATTLRSLERISSLVTPKEARRQIGTTIEQVAELLNAEGSWVENVDVALRLLRLAVSAGSGADTRKLVECTDERWLSVERLQKYYGALFHRGREVKRKSAWLWLRNYLHERRHESFISALPSMSKLSALGGVLSGGLVYRTARIAPAALLRRSRLLAASDLRAQDREDDAYVRNSRDTRDPNWMVNTLADASETSARLVAIRKFVDQLREEDPWAIAPARLFLCTRPPSYFDIARRYSASGHSPIDTNLFEGLLSAVNAIRGTRYRDAVGSVLDGQTISIPDFPTTLLSGIIDIDDPKIVLGNLVVEDSWWKLAAKGQPVHSLARLKGLASVLAKAELAAAPPGSTDLPDTLLVLPELSIPRSWFRGLARHIVGRNRIALAAGLEYEQLAAGTVENQVHAVLPARFNATATWSWTKGFPAHEEGLLLDKLKLSFPPSAPHTTRSPRTVVRSQFGHFSVLICSELLEAGRVAELLGRVELLLGPSWNPDTASYDHVIRTVGMHLNAVVAIANNGHYSDCRAWGPRSVRWKRDMCRLIERDADSVVSFTMPLASLRDHRSAIPALPPKEKKPRGPEWRPLPPDW